MQKQRPFLSVALAFAICLNSTCAISAAAAAPSAPDVENPIFAEDFESYDASLLDGLRRQLERGGGGGGAGSVGKRYRPHFHGGIWSGRTIR